METDGEQQQQQQAQAQQGRQRSGPRRGGLVRAAAAPAIVTAPPPSIPVYATLQSSSGGVSSSSSSAPKQHQHPHMSFAYRNRAILDDACNLLIHHVKRQPNIQKSEKQKIKQILKHFVSDLFFHVRLPLSDDECDDDEKDSCDSKGSTRNPSPVEEKIKKERSPSDKETSAERQPFEFGSITAEDTKPEDPCEFDEYKLFIGTSNWYLFFRLHALLCDRLTKIYERHLVLLEEEERDKRTRREEIGKALYLRPYMSTQVDQYYNVFLDLVKSVLDGNIEPSVYEDSLRELFGIHAYIAFSFDRLIPNATRQLQQCVSDKTASNCYDLYQKESKSATSVSAVGGLCSTAHRRLPHELAYQKKVESVLKGSQPYFKFVVYKNDCSLTIDYMEMDDEDEDENDDDDDNNNNNEGNNDNENGGRGGGGGGGAGGANSMDVDGDQPQPQPQQQKSTKSASAPAPTTTSGSSSSASTTATTTAAPASDTVSVAAAALFKETSDWSIYVDNFVKDNTIAILKTSHAPLAGGSLNDISAATAAAVAGISNLHNWIRKRRIFLQRNAKSTKKRLGKSRAKTGAGAGAAAKKSSNNGSASGYSNGTCTKNVKRGGGGVGAGGGASKPAPMQAQSQSMTYDRLFIDDNVQCKFDLRSYKMHFINHKEMVVYRKESLLTAKKKHQKITLKLNRKFHEWHKKWVEKHVLEAERKRCVDWLMGRIEGLAPGQTRALVHQDLKRAPYAPYIRYKVDMVNS